MTIPPAEKNRTATHRSARVLLATAGWFALGLAALAITSALFDLALATLAGLVETTRPSIWSSLPAVGLGAFLAAMTAISLARRHPRLGAETLRATWVVAAIDLGMATAGAVRGQPFAGVGAFEGLGFLLAAAVMTPLAHGAGEPSSDEKDPPLGAL